MNAEQTPPATPSDAITYDRSLLGPSERTEIPHKIEEPSSEATPPKLLAALLSGPDRRYWPAGSLLLGVLGVATYAICVSAVAGMYAQWATSGLTDAPEQWISATAHRFVYVPLAGAYVSVLFAMQVTGSASLPITVRVALIYGTLYLSMASVFGSFERPVDPLYVLMAAPLCLGSFFQRWAGHWRLSSWNYPERDSTSIHIATLLDATAAIALTLWLARLGSRPLELAAYACAAPASLILGLLGMHVWARLTSICDDSSDSASGFAMWMAGNISFGCVIWLTLTISAPRSLNGAMGLLGATLVVVAAHLWTEVPVRWLRGCGWHLHRVRTNHQRTR